MAYCLLKPLADKFKLALREGKIDPAKLAEMSSEERRTFFEDIIGKDDAHRVNGLFESKLLLKDVQHGMISWAKEVTGIKPEVRRSLISRIEKMDERILNPDTQKAFLEDLATKRLGTEVTFEEAKAITDLSKKLSEAKDAPLAADGSNIKYGEARVEMENFLNDIKRENNKVSMEDFKKNPLKSGVRALSQVGGLAKSLKATLDVSAIGRQGFKTIFTHPKEWALNSGRTFADVFKTLARKTSDERVMDGLKAEIYSRKNSLNGTYDRMKLDIGKGEEAYPSSLPEKIPGLGRVFKASEVAYQGFLTRLRADVADAYVKLAEKQGVDLTDKFQAEAVGSLVNSLTGRGHAFIGKGGEIINSTFFSPKSFQANLDFLTAHSMEKMSGFARKQAVINILKVVGGTAGVLAIANAVRPGSVETDPRSADFGKIRVGDTRFDVSGGMSSLLTLAARIFTQSSKSSITNKVAPFGTKMGEQTGTDVLLSFLGNKLSPVAGLGRDVIRQQDSKGNPITLGGEIYDTFTPLPITNAIELMNSSDSKAEKIAAMVADALGVATNTYSSANVKSAKIPENKNIKNKDFISEVVTYAKAMGTDPETAFNRIFTGQKIRRVDNGTIIVERMSLKDSTAVKKKGGGNNPTMKLDHTVPLELGGSNDESNLKLVTTAEWASYSPIENKVGQLLRDGKLNKKEAQDLIQQFKQGKVKAAKILAM